MAYCILNSYKLKVSPFEVFQALKNRENCFFLDSSLNSDYSLGRYSILGFEPFYIFKAKNQEPFQELRQALGRFKISLKPKNLPFLCGAVGYLSYDAGLFLEKKLKIKANDDLNIPDCFFGFYNSSIIIDNFKKIIYICAGGFPEKRYYLAKALCKENIKKIYNLLSGASFKPGLNIDKRKAETYELKSNFSKQGYLSAIGKAKQYIKNGDIYQVNLSQRLEAKTGLSAFEIYKNLRKVSPSYFSAYMDCTDFQILSSSPERFLSLNKGKVITRPMKGTRPRSERRRQDTALKKELMSSAKDKAELTMIVDLERNDLGRVCDYKSVKVSKLRQLEKYNTVYQTTATVEGKLHNHKDRIDLLRACFPSGSVTGCPKIRAMEIIEELEPNRRSIYTGSLGYLSFCEDMDFNILIRTILKQQEKVYFGVGGGIVADSEPEKEYAETLVKAKAMLRAIRI